MSRILLSADSTCDLGDELKEQYQVHYYPFHIILEGRDYQDNVDITPQDIFQAYYDRKVLPRTAAINVQEYLDYFRPFTEQGYEVVHLNLGGALSSAHQNCLLAARELLRRQPDKADRRVIHLALTDAGAALAREGQKLQSTCLDALFAGLTQSEAERFQELLGKVLTSAEVRLKEGGNT